MGDYASYDTGTALRNGANQNKVFKILTVDSIREWLDLNSQPIGKSKNIKGGMDLKLCEVEILT